MKAKLLNSLLISALVGLLIVVPTSAKLNASPVVLSGTVTDPLGNGAENQWVTLTSEDGSAVYATQSGPDGRYSFPDIASGNYFIRVSNTQISRNVPPRYWIATHSTIGITTNTTLDFQLPFVMMIAEVKKSDFSPFPDVDLFTSRPYNTDLSLGGFPAHGKSQYIQEEPGVTDSSGVSLLWLFPTQGSQSYDVTAKPDPSTGYSGKIVREVTLTETKTLTIVMDPPQNLSGIVTYPAGIPLSNQVVTAIPQPPDPTTYPSATTRPSGSFVFSVAPNQYNLRVEKDGYSADTPSRYWITTNAYPLTIVADRQHNANLILPFEDLTLTVVDQNGNPLPNASVVTDQQTNNNLTLDGELASGASQYTSAYPAYSDANGMVILRLFPTEGSNGYTVSVTPPSGSSTSSVTITGVQVPNSEPVEVAVNTGQANTGGGNQSPVADAGPDQTVSCGSAADVVLLDGTGSYDPNNDSLTFTWSGGFLTDTLQGAQVGVSCPTAGSYSVTLQVTDAHGASDSDTVEITVSDSGNNHNEQSNALEAFAGGGGWFKSPEGALLTDPDASGKLTIGFVVRYHTGQTAPSGHTVIRLHGSDFAIWAYDFSTMKIMGDLATFEGIGMDKEGNLYELKVSLFNGWNPGDEKGDDLIRITVWNLSTGELVYDNEPGTPESSMPSTKLQGGSISIKN